MTPAPNFEASCELLRELDITIEEARSTPETFGSWFIRATAKGKLIRIVWDGRDGALVDCSVEADLGWEGEEGSCDGGVNPLQEEVEGEHVRDA